MLTQLVLGIPYRIGDGALNVCYLEICYLRAYAFVYNIQEEAHRFAIKHSTGAKRKCLTRSTLLNIEGIGPIKARALLAAMPLGKIKTATKKELEAVKGIGKRDAESIYSYYHKEK